MAGIQLNQLPLTTDTEDADIFHIQRAGVDLQATKTVLTSDLSTSIATNTAAITAAEAATTALTTTVNAATVVSQGNTNAITLLNNASTATNLRVSAAEGEIDVIQLKDTQQDTAIGAIQLKDTQQDGTLAELTLPKTLPYTSAATLVAGYEVNELRAAGNYSLPLANSVAANTAITVALPEQLKHLTPVVMCSGTDTMVCSSGTDTSMQLDIGEAVTVTFVSNGTNQWRI